MHAEVLDCTVCLGSGSPCVDTGVGDYRDWCVVVVVAKLGGHTHQVFEYRSVD